MTFYKFLAAFVGSSIVLYITLRIWGAITDDGAEIWKPAAAGLLTSVCIVFLPSPWNDVVSFIAVLGLLRLIIVRGEWGDIFYPMLISRLSLVAILLPFAIKAAP